MAPEELVRSFAPMIASARPLWLRITRGAFFLLVCTSALIFGAALRAVGYGTSEVMSEIISQAVLQTKPEVVFDDRDAVTILLLGCDEDRAPGGKRILRKSARSDMMLVARLDFARHRITAISIPRDTLVSIPGHGQQKINAYHAIGGEKKGKELARIASESVVGTPIDRVIVIDYEAFQEVVDMVGGVDVFVNKPLRYTDRRGGLFINLKAGKQHLNGYDAMCFVRYRHGDSDFMRQQRQKDFLLALRDAVIKHWSKLGQIADKSVQVLGSGLSPKEVAALALFSRSIGNDNIKMGQVPVIEVENYNLIVDRSKLRDLLREFSFHPTTDSGASFK